MCNITHVSNQYNYITVTIITHRFKLVSYITLYSNIHLTSYSNYRALIWQLTQPFFYKYDSSFPLRQTSHVHGAVQSTSKRCSVAH